MSRLTMSLKFAAAAALPLLLVGVVVQRDIDTRWDQMAVHLDQLGAERRARDTEREAAYGDTVDGPAWPHFEFALNEMKRVWDTMPIHNFDAVEAKTPEERAERDALLAELEPAFEALHRGAHARDASTGVDLSDGSLEDAGALPMAWYLSNFAVAKAQSQIERGEDLAGVDTLLDTMQLGRDLVTASSLVEEMMGLALLANEYLLQWLAGGGADQMSDEAKERWLDGMDRIHASIPAQSPAMAGELERFLRGLRRTVKPEASQVSWMSNQDWHGPSRGPGLAYQFSWRAAAADLMDRAPDLVRRGEAAYGLSGVATMEALESLQAEMEADDNPLIGHFGRYLVITGRSRIYCMARFDFLRHALAVHLGLDVELPGDPWGRGVRVEVDGDRVRVWTPSGEGDGALDVTVGMAK